MIWNNSTIHETEASIHNLAVSVVVIWKSIIYMTSNRRSDASFDEVLCRHDPLVVLVQARVRIYLG